MANFQHYAWKQGSCLSEMEWVAFKSLFWNANDPILKLIIFIISGVSLWYRFWYKNMLNYDNDDKCIKPATILQ